MPQRPETWEPSVSFRLPEAHRAAVLSLREPLGGVESATTSEAMRELIGVALAVFDASSARRVARYARRLGISREEAWRRVVSEGLDALAPNDPE